MSNLGSYSSIFTLGHRALKELLKGEVNVEEKVDGSQFSFGLVEASPVDIVYEHEGLKYALHNTATGETVALALKIRSKGCMMHVDAPEKMFSLAGATVRRLGPALHPGWVYRGEYLQKPHHNALTYDRVPAGNIILFDIQTEDQGFLSYDEKKAEADRLGLEVVPLLFRGIIKDVAAVREFLGTTSVLGGQQLEGVVIKPTAYNLYGLDKKVLMGKFVSEAFKEVHNSSWKEKNPTAKDVITQAIEKYTSQARWNKAIQHLKEAGKLVDDVQDIGPIIREIPEDILRECVQEMKDDLFSWAWPHIRRGLTVGFPEYYKELLMKRSFEVEDVEVVVDVDHPQEPVDTDGVEKNAESVHPVCDIPPDLAVEVKS